MPERQLLDGHGTFVVHGLLGRPECAAWIARAEALGFGEAPINTLGGAVRRPDVRNNDRAMADRPEWAEALWTRVAPHFADIPSLTPALGLNERFRFYRYSPGQRFAPHMDGWFQRPGTTERSLYTAMIYLNDGYTGGETRFYQHDTTVVPVSGMALFFVHRQLHEGCAVRSGVKYVLRTDVLFDLGA